MIKIQDNVILEISKDGLEAYISLLEDKETPIPHDFNKILSEVKKHITFGLNESLLKDIIENDIYTDKICIAKGKNSIDGKDGKVKYHFEPQRNLIPKLKSDGTVDYRELNAINNISKDDILAEIIPPIDGINGRKVTGEEIPFKKGRIPKFKKGKNTYISHDGLYLKSETDGIIEFKNGNIKVLEILVVHSVDNSIGNIDFLGNVVVNRDILNGFKVKSIGSVEVKGALEGGYIESEDDVLIRQGIQGYNRLSVNTKGNLATKFIENSTINVKGNITAEAIMHSNVNSKSNILLVGKKGLIVGGICRASQEIRAKIIGSTMATTTVVEVGIDPQLKERYVEIEKELESNREKLRKINQSLNVLDVLKKANKLDGNKEKLYEDLLKAIKTITFKNENLENEFTKLSKDIENLSAGKIKVADTIYPGVKVVIGNSYLFVREEMKRCTFFKDGGEIRIGSY